MPTQVSHHGAPTCIYHRHVLSLLHLEYCDCGTAPFMTLISCYTFASAFTPTEFPGSLALCYVGSVLKQVYR